MRKFSIFMVIVALLASITPVMSGQSAEDEAAIKKVVEQLYAALNKKDIKAAFALCDENFEDYSGTLKGREANEKRWMPIFETRFKNVQYKPIEEIGIQFITPDVAIYKDSYDFTGALDKDGNTLPSSKWSNAHVLVKKDSKWMYATMIQWAQ
jgi:uncharacterized protein (TIGR02246 family)